MGADAEQGQEGGLGGVHALSPLIAFAMRASRIACHRCLTAQLVMFRPGNQGLRRLLCESKLPLHNGFRDVLKHHFD